VRSFISDDLDRQKQNAYRNGRVRDIERWPMICTKVEFDEVDNISIGDPIVQIAQGTTQNERQGNLQQTILRRASKAVRDYDNCGTGSENGQQ
jgi:hypothetical protein